MENRLNLIPTKQELIEFFRNNPHKAFNASQLRGLFNVNRKEKKNFKSRLKGLVKDGIVRIDLRRRYSLLEEKTTDNVSVQAKSPRSKKSKEREVEVEIELKHTKKIKKKAEDEVRKGRMQRTGNRWWVVDLKNAGQKYLASGRGEWSDGVLVLYKPVRAKEPGAVAKARVFGTLDNGEKWDEVTDAFLKKNNLEPEFPVSVQKQVAKHTQLDESEYDRREDYRDLHTICIDPEGARDHDDAISLEKLPRGRWRLGVHIADVSHYVTEDSPLDKEALRRSFTQYLPWCAVPMLPESLSTDLCSLKQGKDRFAFSCMIELSPRGIVESFDFEKTLINVDSFVTYEEAMELCQKKVPEFVNLQKLTRYLNARREKEGILLMDMPETKVAFDEKGEPSKMLQKTYLESQNWIEECMLLANQCCAKWLGTHKLQGIYRVHEPPKWDSVSELLQAEPGLLADGEGVDFKSLESGGNNKNVNPAKFALYQRIVKRARGNIVLMRKILRSMSKARYAATSDGHFALNWLDYAHFTSPIRRYADLYVHRRMTRILEGQREGDLEVEAHQVAEKISENEIGIMKCERAGIKVCAAWIVKDHVGEVFNGVISGMEEFGIFVELPEVAGEGLVKYQEIPGDYYVYNPEKRIAYGRKSRRIFAMGDKVKVQVIRVQVMRGEVDLAIVLE